MQPWLQNKHHTGAPIPGRTPKQLIRDYGLSNLVRAVEFDHKFPSFNTWHRFESLLLRAQPFLESIKLGTKDIVVTSTMNGAEVISKEHRVILISAKDSTRSLKMNEFQFGNITSIVLTKSLLRAVGNRDFFNNTTIHWCCSSHISLELAQQLVGSGCKFVFYMDIADTVFLRAGVRRSLKNIGEAVKAMNTVKLPQKVCIIHASDLRVGDYLQHSTKSFRRDSTPTTFYKIDEVKSVIDPVFIDRNAITYRLAGSGELAYDNLLANTVVLVLRDK